MDAHEDVDADPVSFTEAAAVLPDPVPVVDAHAIGEDAAVSQCVFCATPLEFPASSLFVQVPLFACFLLKQTQTLGNAFY